jgi:hypothetical protein
MPQHKLPNKHGGHRQNSGRHKNSETLGCPVRFRGLQQFGFTRNDITAQTTSTLGTPPVAMMAVADGANSQGPTKHQRQAMSNSMSTTKKNVQLDPIDVMPIWNHNQSKCYNPSSGLLYFMLIEVFPASGHFLMMYSTYDVKEDCVDEFKGFLTLFLFGLLQSL